MNTSEFGVPFVRESCTKTRPWLGTRDRPHLAIHILQPLQPQVGDNRGDAVVYWEDVHSELLRGCCCDLSRGPEKNTHHLEMRDTCQVQDRRSSSPCGVGQVGTSCPLSTWPKASGRWLSDKTRMPWEERWENEVPSQDFDCCESWSSGTGALFHCGDGVRMEAKTSHVLGTRSALHPQPPVPSAIEANVALR